MEAGEARRDAEGREGVLICSEKCTAIVRATVVAAATQVTLEEVFMLM